MTCGWANVLYDSLHFPRCSFHNFALFKTPILLLYFSFSLWPFSYLTEEIEAFRRELPQMSMTSVHISTSVSTCLVFSPFIEGELSLLLSPSPVLYISPSSAHDYQTPFSCINIFPFSIGPFPSVCCYFSHL